MNELISEFQLRSKKEPLSLSIFRYKEDIRMNHSKRNKIIREWICFSVYCNFSSFKKSKKCYRSEVMWQTDLSRYGHHYTPWIGCLFKGVESQWVVYHCSRNLPPKVKESTCLISIIEKSIDGNCGNTVFCFWFFFFCFLLFSFFFSSICI